MEPLSAMVKWGGLPHHFDGFLAEVEDEGAVKIGDRWKRVGAWYGTECSFFEVVGVPGVGPVVGQGRGPSNGVYPMHGA